MTGRPQVGGFDMHSWATSGSLAAEIQKPWYERCAQDRILSTEAYERAKRLLDIVVCLALLPVVLFILGLCCVLIRLDSPGPVFFTQGRTGSGGSRFKMLKMRTMVQNAEELKSKYAAFNELTPPDFKIKDDPRITRVGRILRKTSIDELPQIFNVLRGDMSLVGPRPTSFRADTYALWHTARLEPKPGITGIWQVSGRNELDFDERVRLDIAYSRNQCLWLDLQILVRTISCVFTGRGAN
jgi:lipopolysaccharide/colanic/teichoic acid biosynthesis glycosyltransferase